MAPKNKNILSEIFSSSPNFVSQLLFGLLIFIIAAFAGVSIPVSICIGILGGSILGWITTANENNPQPTTVASNDGIDAALKYWLFFMLGFVLFGYPAPISIFFGILAGIGGGWIIAWWRSKEETRTQLPEISLDAEETEVEAERPAKKIKRRATKRFRRAAGSFNFRFWER
jgi:positive regulator of sigma E activity